MGTGVKVAILMATMVDQDDSSPLLTKRIKNMSILELKVCCHGVVADQVLLDCGASAKKITKSACLIKNIGRWFYF